MNQAVCRLCGEPEYVDDWAGCPRCYHMRPDHFDATLEGVSALVSILGDGPPRLEDSLLDELLYDDERLPKRSEREWLSHMRARHAKIVDRAANVLGPVELDAPEEKLRLEDLEPGFDFPEVALFDVSSTTCVLIYLQTRPGQMQTIFDIWNSDREF